MRTPPSATMRVAALSAASFLMTVAISGATIAGKITDAQTAAPLASMVAAAYSAEGELQASATSDTTGKYSLNVPAGSYRVLAYDNAGVYATTYFGDAESFESSAPIAPDATNINFALRRAGTVTGSVSTGGGVASGVTVAAYNPDGTRRGFTKTTSAGAYALILPPGSYKIASYDDAGTFWPRFFQDQSTFATANNVTVNAGAATPVSFTLDVAAHITGNVFESATHLPLATLIVDAYDLSGVRIAETTTDSNGGFNLRVPPGTFRVVVSDPQQNYAIAYYGGLAFSTATNIAIAAGATQPNIVVTTQRAGTVNGQTVDTTGTLVNVTIAAYGLDGTLRATTQTSNGTFRLSLAPGQYKLAAYDNNLVYATQFFSGQLTFAAATPVTVTSGVTPGPLLLFTLVRGARISGTLVDSGTRATLPSMTVAAYENTTATQLASAMSDANGNYAFVLPAGSYRFVAFDGSLHYAASFAGGASYETAHVYPETSGASDVVSFNLSRGIHVNGVVKDVSGSAVTGVQVSAIDPSGNHAGTATTTNGTFDLILLPNQYRFTVIDPQGRFIMATTPSTFNVAWDAAPPSVTITLVTRARRRSVSH